MTLNTKRGRGDRKSSRPRFPVLLTEASTRKGSIFVRAFGMVFQKIPGFVSGVSDRSSEAGVQAGVIPTNRSRTQSSL